MKNIKKIDEFYGGNNSNLNEIEKTNIIIDNEFSNFKNDYETKLHKLIDNIKNEFGLDGMARLKILYNNWDKKFIF